MCVFYRGVDKYVDEGLKWVTNALETQLAMAGTAHGLSAGALLICGVTNSGNAGCGITSIAKEICCKAINYPLLAHIIVMECSILRGKVSKFKEVLSEKMSEARWYQPSIVLLDDIDHIAPSILNGQDHSVETSNSERISESKNYLS